MTLIVWMKTDYIGCVATYDDTNLLFSRMIRDHQLHSCHLCPIIYLRCSIG